jgi:MFS family permease
MRAVRQYSRNVLLLAATSFFADVSSEMLYPVLPLYLTQVLAAPANVVGIVEGVAEATQNAVQGASGWVADRVRRNKPVALVGYGVSALGKPVMGLATTWPQLLVGRFADRLGSGIRSAPRDALIAGSAGDQQRGAAFGLEGIGDNLGAVVGPLIAALLLYLFAVPLRSIFFLAFIPGVVAFLLVAAVTEARPVGSNAPPRLSFGLGDLPPTYWKYLVAVAVFGIGNSSNAFIILKATVVGIPTELTVLIYAGFNLIAAAVSYPAGDMSDHFGRQRLFLAALAIFVVAYLGFAVSENAFVVGLLFILYGAYQGTFRTVGKTLATDLVPSDRRATGVGIYASVVGLAALVASIVGGQLWVRVGPTATFLYGAWFAFLGGLLLAVLIPNTRQTSH